VDLQTFSIRSEYCSLCGLRQAVGKHTGVGLCMHMHCMLVS
jgi:hypothetical protein